MVMLETLLATLSVYIKVVDAKAGDNVPSETIKLVSMASPDAETITFTVTVRFWLFTKELDGIVPSIAVKT